MLSFTMSYISFTDRLSGLSTPSPMISFTMSYISFTDCLSGLFTSSPMTSFTICYISPFYRSLKRVIYTISYDLLHYDFVISLSFTDRLSGASTLPEVSSALSSLPLWTSSETVTAIVNPISGGFTITVTFSASSGMSIRYILLFPFKPLSCTNWHILTKIYQMKQLHSSISITNTVKANLWV